MDIKNHEEVLYVIEVYGYAPEFWPAVAFCRRGAKNRPDKKERQKEIKCPYCRELLFKVGITRRLELLRFGKKVKANCHEYRSCHKCHEKVGIIYIAG